MFPKLVMVALHFSDLAQSQVGAKLMAVCERIAIAVILVQCIIDLVIVYLLSLVGVNKTVEIGAA